MYLVGGVDSVTAPIPVDKEVVKLSHARRVIAVNKRCLNPFSFVRVVETGRS